MRELPIKNQLFIAEYLIDMNGKRAYRKIYDPKGKMSDQTLEVCASKLLSKAKVKEELAKKTKELTKESNITAELVLNELLKIATVDIRDAYDEDGNLKNIKDLPESIAKAMAGCEVDELSEGLGRDRTRIGHTKKIKFWNKVNALELLGKYLRLFEDNKDNTQDKPIELTLKYSLPESRDKTEPIKMELTKHEEKGK